MVMQRITELPASVSVGDLIKACSASGIDPRSVTIEIESDYDDEGFSLTLLYDDGVPAPEPDPASMEAAKRRLAAREVNRPPGMDPEDPPW